MADTDETNRAGIALCALQVASQQHPGRQPDRARPPRPPLAEHVHAGASFVGSLQPHGRLDPPMLMALDEVTQICPIPLPNWMNAGVVLYDAYFFSQRVG